jgi:hypothetical protein
MKDFGEGLFFIIILLISNPIGWLVLGGGVMVLAAFSDGIFGTTIVQSLKDVFS